MNKRICIILLSICFVLGLLSLVNAEQSEKVFSGKDLYNKIANDLQESDDLNFVTYINENGDIYSTKNKEFKKVGKTTKLKPGQKSIIVDSEKLYLPTEGNTTEDFSILTNTGHGPYRRIKSNAGYRKVEGTAVTSGGSNIYMVGGDTAYLYLGGSTATGNIDFGLIYSPAKNAWFPFYLHNGTMKVFSDSSESPWGLTGVPAGTNVFLRFYIPMDNQTALYMSTPDGKSATFTLDMNPYFKYLYNGNGVSMKRLTTIGQKPEEVNSGSYFKGSRWADVKIATLSTMGYWTSTHTAERTIHPDSTKVIVRTTNFDYNEAVDIILN